MTTRSEAPPPEVVAAHHQQSATRRRRGWRLVWMIVGGFLLLLMLIPAVVYFLWQAHGRSLLREQLADIKASGDPLTTSEMTAWHVVPKGQRDVTDLWVAALKPFEGPVYDAAALNTPIVGAGNPNLPPLDQPLSSTDEQQMQLFLTQAKPWIAGMHAAADVEGEVSFQHDFRDGAMMLLPLVQKMRTAVRTMQVEFELLVREDKFDAAIDNLETRIIAGETLRHDPILISMLVRIAVHSMNFSDIGRLAETGQLSDAQLVRLQQLIRPIDIHAQLPDAMIGERALAFHAFHGPMRAALNEEQTTPHETTDNVGDVSRPEDCALAMQLLTRMIDAAKEPLPGAFEATDNVDRDLKAIVGGNLPLTRFRYAMTALLLPATGSVAKADARGEVARDLLDTALAARRYHLKHGAAPQSIDDLAPDFLPQVPRDSFDGQPLRMRASDDCLVLYSVGENRTDDGGITDAANRMPDIAIEVKLHTNPKR